MIRNKKVAVVMICKNEAGIITRALESVEPIADAFVIQDNGSTDNTMHAASEWLYALDNKRKLLVSTVYSTAWVNFAHNRNDVLRSFEAIAKAAGENPDDWLVMSLDADDQLVLERDVVDLRLSNQEANAISLTYKLNELTYARVPMVSPVSSWTWDGVVHEYLKWNGQGQPVHADLIGAHIIASSSEGARSSDTNKYLKDALAIEAALDNDPTNRRYQFYLARSYHDHFKMCGEIQYMELAKRAYTRRSKVIPGQPEPFEEERWYSEYMYATLTHDLEKIIDVVSQRPWRAEAALAASTIAEERGQMGTAYTYALLAVEAAKLQRIDVLFVDRSAYGWKAYDRLGTIAYYAEYYTKGVQAIDYCLFHPDNHGQLSEADRTRLQNNRSFYLSKITPFQQALLESGGLPI